MLHFFPAKGNKSENTNTTQQFSFYQLQYRHKDIDYIMAKTKIAIAGDDIE